MNNNNLVATISMQDVSTQILYYWENTATWGTQLITGVLSIILVVALIKYYLGIGK